MAPARGPATHLVVLVHGYGADGQDLIGLAQHWQSLLPTVAFAAPNAPTRVPGGAGYQWFPISRMDPHEMRKGVEAAAPVLDEYLDAELARLGLPPERLALAGFSQGTMLSLHLGPAPQGQACGDCGIFGSAGRSAAGRMVRYPAHSSDPWRQRPGDPAPGDVCGRNPAGSGGGAPCNGIWRPAWAMASTRRGWPSRDSFSASPSGAGWKIRAKYAPSTNRHHESAKLLSRNGLAP